MSKGLGRIERRVLEELEKDKVENVSGGDIWGREEGE